MILQCYLDLSADWVENTAEVDLDNTDAARRIECPGCGDCKVEDPDCIGDKVVLLKSHGLALDGRVLVHILLVGI